MSGDSNTEIVKQIYDAFTRADLASILDSLAEDIVWLVPHGEVIPWGGDRRGKAEVTAFFIAIAAQLDVEQFDATEFAGCGELVLVLGREQMRVKSTGKVYVADWAHVWKLAKGKVTEFREYTDTASMIEALRH